MRSLAGQACWRWRQPFYLTCSAPNLPPALPNAVSHPWVVQGCRCRLQTTEIKASHIRQQEMATYTRRHSGSGEGRAASIKQAEGKIEIKQISASYN